MKDEYDFSKGVRGPVIPPRPGTAKVWLRLDDEVMDWFRDQVESAGGGDYSLLINEALREHIQRARNGLGGGAA